MVGEFKMRLEGGKELEVALKRLGGAVAGRLGANAVRAGARVIVKEAKAKAPVDTGALRSSIRVFTDRGEARKGGSVRTAYIGSRARHAHLVEFGSVHTPAQPFLRPAADEAGQNAVTKVGENLAAGIAREVAKRS